MNISRKRIALSAILAAGIITTSATAFASCQTRQASSQADSAKADTTAASGGSETQAAKEEKVIKPELKESGDTRFLLFPEYRGKLWTIRDNGEQTSLETEDKTINLTSQAIPAEDMEHQLFNVVDARIYNGRIWIIGYGDYDAGMVADRLGTLVVYYDIASGMFGYVKNCHDAKFEGKTIKYDEQVLKKRGASRAEDEYTDNWKTYQMD